MKFLLIFRLPVLITGLNRGEQMKRYFDLYEERNAAEVDIIDGSPACDASEKVFADFFKTSVREISPQKYIALSKKYAEG